MKKIVTILLVLVVLLAALLVIRHFTGTEFSGLKVSFLVFIRHFNGTEFSGLKVSYLGREFLLQKEQLPELPFKELWADDEKFQAVTIAKILEKFSIKPAKVRSITFISKDGGALVLKEEDLSQAYLALEKQGKKQQFRLIIPGEVFRQRWLKRVVELQVR